METRQERLAKRRQEATIRISSDFESINDTVDEGAIATRREKAAFIRQVSQRRSPKYMELVSERMSLELKREELRRKLYMVPDEVPNSSKQGNQPDDKERDNELDLSSLIKSVEPKNTQSTNLESLLKNNSIVENEKPISIESIIKPSVNLNQVKATTHLSGPMIDKKKIRDELNRLDEELKEINDKLLEEFPVGSRMLIMVYDSQFEKRLIEKKVIACQGLPFNTPKEQDEATKNFTLEEKEAIHWGYDRFMEIGMRNSSAMFVETYLELCCVVYEDGEVEVIRR